MGKLVPRLAALKRGVDNRLGWSPAGLQETLSLTCEDLHRVLQVEMPGHEVAASLVVVAGNQLAVASPGDVRASVLVEDVVWKSRPLVSGVAKLGAKRDARKGRLLPADKVQVVSLLANVQRGVVLSTAGVTELLPVADEAPLVQACETPSDAADKLLRVAEDRQTKASVAKTGWVTQEAAKKKVKCSLVARFEWGASPEELPEPAPVKRAKPAEPQPLPGGFHCFPKPVGPVEPAAPGELGPLARSTMRRANIRN